MDRQCAEIIPRMYRECTENAQFTKLCNIDTKCKMRIIKELGIFMRATEIDSDQFKRTAVMDQ